MTIDDVISEIHAMYAEKSYLARVALYYGRHSLSMTVWYCPDDGGSKEAHRRCDSPVSTHTRGGVGFAELWPDLSALALAQNRDRVSTLPSFASEVEEELRRAIAAARRVGVRVDPLLSGGG